MRKVPPKYKLAFSLWLLSLLFPPSIFAHTINYSLEKAPTQTVLLYYLKLGFHHIIPGGLDHILFVSALCLFSMKNIIVVPSAITEPIIAMSIVFVAVENIMFSELKAWRILIVFMFGLIHGMGFASALNEIGLPPNKFYTSILAFNGGVELGQAAIIVIIFSSLVILCGKKIWYRHRVVYPLSAVIAVIAGYWTITRLFFN